MTTLDQDLFMSYIFLASAHCLLKYMGSTFSVRFPPRCLRVLFGYGYGGRLVIDRHSVKDLELVSNARTGSQKESLFGCINKTKTDVGAKALKANLLAPLTDRTTIEGRLDLVELLIARGGPEVIDSIQATLGCLTALDRMLAGIAVIEMKEDVASAKKMINTVVLLKTFLRLAPTLVEELTQLLPERMEEEEEGGMEDEGGGEEGGAPPAEALVRAIIAALSPPVFAEITALLQEFISESTIHERSAKTRRLQECFAVSAGLCGLLDVRTSFPSFPPSLPPFTQFVGRVGAPRSLTALPHSPFSPSLFPSLPPVFDRWPARPFSNLWRTSTPSPPPTPNTTASPSCACSTALLVGIISPSPPPSRTSPPCLSSLV